MIAFFRSLKKKVDRIQIDSRQEILQKIESYERLRSIFNVQWKKKITKIARFTTQIKKNEKQESALPLSNDITRLNKGLDELLDSSMQLLLAEPTFANWKHAAETLLVKITIFNARRPLEPGLITKKLFMMRIRGEDKEIDNIAALSKSEKLLSKSMSVIKVVGKHARIVPVLLTKGFTEKIQILLDTRDECGVAKSNPYIFAKGTTAAMHGSKITTDLVKKLKETCRLEKPGLITAKQFRRILATSCQCLALTEGDMESLCGHLGHDMRTHLQYYRLHTDAAELSKVAKLLLLMDSKELYKHAGKTLKEIDVVVPGRFLY